jgi:glyoxylase-like metal-dependent hydrolase (beta-lactamase superfamily II)
MRIHHLNTATMCPVGKKLVNGSGGLFARGRLVCHTLLLETADGLILVDTGLGLGDVAAPRRLGRTWLRQARPRLDAAETAAAQVEALGFSVDDVRHIALTHLDLDHAGGVPDFPAATIHVHRREHAAAVAHTIPARPWRYIDGHWAHGPRWRLWDDGGEAWFGFEGVRALDERDPDILLVPLPGHTPGHSGIAVRDGDRWLLHAGDAYFFHTQIDTPPVAPPLGLRYFQRRADTDRAARVANQERLRVLREAHGDRITIFNGHDPFDFDAAVAATALGGRSSSSSASRVG